MITGEENIQFIADHFPIVVPEFEKIGLGHYFNKENLIKIGRFTRLKTLLKSSGIDTARFILLLNGLIDGYTNTPGTGNAKDQRLHFMAMLPCGLRNPFKDFLEAHLQDNMERYGQLNYLTEGNVNHELSYYPLLDNIESPDELPDVIIASDVNNFFHKPFVSRFIETNIFQAYIPYPVNPYLKKADFPDPSGHYTMLTANMLVMAVDETRLGKNRMPERWEDLLSPAFENEIIMRGEDDFFCNAVMLPFYKDHGFEAIRILSRQIRCGKHPAEMVKLADSGNEGAATIYILPYFFAQRIKNKNTKIVWPEDGAIASPVFLLAKSDTMEKHQPLLDFLLSKETGEMLVMRSFPSVNPEVKNLLPKQIKWLGWDFLTTNDIGKIKQNIQEVFMNGWKQKQSISDDKK